MSKVRLVKKWIDSPVGRIVLVANERALVGAYFEGHAPAPRFEASEVEHDAVIDRAEAELAEYFASKRVHFEVPTEASGTPFQRRVWDALATIPFGQTWSYSRLAKAIGSPNTARAVGTANAHNPLSLFVPCHRVIGENGELRGYAGGTAAKQWLLAHESARMTEAMPAAS